MEESKQSTNKNSSSNFAEESSSSSIPFYWSSEKKEPITISWRDLSVYVLGKPQCQRIINNVTGAVQAGSLVALMGASGAGKTSLMNALAFRTADNVVVEGDVLINGRPGDDNFMKNISGFMYQEDIFIDYLTVEEHLNITARLILDRRMSSENRRKKISEIMKNLSLLKCRKNKIFNISGGEKKRLSFATELLTNPPLLFCDEPTTGLDSYSARKLVAVMNVMAAAGKTVLCTIHQPSSQIFKMFNQLILLANGRIAYMGTTENAYLFFESLGYRIPSNYSPADFYIRTLAVLPGFEDSCRNTIRIICDRYAVSDYAKENDVKVRYEMHMAATLPNLLTTTNFKSKQPFCLIKLLWLTYRYLLDITRKPSVHLMRLFQKAILATMVALCFVGSIDLNQARIQAIQGLLFVLVTENTFSPMYSVLESFPLDRSLFLREYKSGFYSIGTYYVSRVLAMLPGLLLDPILFVTVAYHIAGLRQDLNSYLSTMLITILTMNVSTSCGLMFSNAFDSSPMAFSILVPFDYILMITSGLFIRISTIPVIVSWTKYVSWLMYAMESLTIVQWKGIINISCEYNNTEIPCVTSGSQVLENLNFSENHFYLDLINMSIICLTFHLLSLLFLFKRINRKS